MVARRGLVCPAKQVFTAMVAMTLLATPWAGIGAPVLGRQLFWSGGDVTVTLQSYEAAFTNELILFSTAQPKFLALNRDVGLTVTLTASELDVDHDVGQELLFGIYVRDTGNTFLMGGRSRNPDSELHVAVDVLGEGLLKVGAEDLFDGVDRDYDDTVFEFRGGVSVDEVARRGTLGSLSVVVPEPGTFALVGLGLAGLAVARRRKQ